MQPTVNLFQHADFRKNSKWHTDPVSDDAVARIIGPWNEHSPMDNAAPWANLRSAIRHFPANLRNDQLPEWKAPDTFADRDARDVLGHYVRTVGSLPYWADLDKIERASDLFMANGALSSVILFCSSLPECYHYPSISSLLQSSGNLEHQTAYRIRSTATMVFPVMLGGGLTQGDGRGILPVVRSRFTHAMIRNLVLRGHPAERCRMGEDGDIFLPKGPLVESIDAGSDKKDPFQSTFFNGWDLAQFGMPCNQEEQAYVLLCFSHVFLRGMHRMGVRLDSAQEDAFLHAWNVIGHVLGIDGRLMATTQGEAASLLSTIQSQGVESQDRNPAQPALTNALISTMEEALPWAILKPLPTLMVQHLGSSLPNASVRQQHHGPQAGKHRIAGALFTTALFLATRLDKMAAGLKIRFSIMQSTIHILGRRFVVEILKMDPDTLHQNIDSRRQPNALPTTLDKNQQLESA